MGIKNDYLMRMIEDMVRFVAQLLLGKSAPTYELPESQDVYNVIDDLFSRLLKLSDSGQINEAENLLFEELDSTDQDYLEMGLTFYLHLSEMDDDFLEDHGYSREEIKDGVQMLGKEFGVTGLEN